MFIAMNRFTVRAGREADFEGVWRDRDSFLADVPGFEGFHLLRGPTTGDTTLFVSHSAWRSKADFDAWTESEAFRRAHGDARTPQGTVVRPPSFEGFEVVL